MFAKRFAYVCTGLLCLAVTYHLGARKAGAQSSGERVVAVTSYYVAKEDKAMIWAVTEGGDAYAVAFRGTITGESWRQAGNVLGLPIAPPKSR